MYITMASSARPRRNVSIATIVVRLVTYFVVVWGTIVALCGGLFPHARLLAFALAVYTTIPVLVLMRWRGWPFYPTAAFRLFVVRPFWYTQLLLPVVSAAGLLGLLIGAPVGHALAVGQLVAG